MRDLNLRDQFPILSAKVHGKPLVYLDNAATTQKPLRVLKAIHNYYERLNSNVHRGIHQLSQFATDAYEESREKVRSFINAGKPEEIIFTRGCTEAINLVARSWGGKNLGPGDVVLLSEMEHHSNIVPWQLVCEERGASVKPIPISDSGELDLSALPSLITDKVKLISVTHVSNVLGTINPVEKIISLAHARRIPVHLDGAQAVAHVPTDVRSLDVDFYSFSGHKMYGPTGIGVLYGKEALLESMPPYQGGGEMIERVTFEKTTFDELPRKFEAGTPPIADAIALGTAIDFLVEIGLANIQSHEAELLKLATQLVANVPELKLVGTSRDKIGIVSVHIPEIHSHDIGTVLDLEGVAVRTGHHCCMPLMARLGITGTTRASFGVYNTQSEVEKFVSGLKKAIELFRR